ncbi:hypothetical protein SCHPADRAFT_946061 [Schizopora paradoxa]|uniref:F-box domain-containing protein n=1 Tax=Schizopora paradoxa TaxID=27342 RepID=A0A0H2RNT6_9AGAM|nr:hypothetical protein SCHPADRAFT_946061 [Schizopora paradoxa]
MARRAQKRVKVLDTEDEADASTSQATEGSSKKKRKVTGVKKRTTIKGKLSKLLEMPMEIFTEIACYMSPEDLLNLSRASRGLREILMSKSSERVWEAARKVQGNIPARPPDLNEPQYADLLFGKGCSFCSESRTKKVYVSLRVRACSKCFEKHIADFDAVYQQNRNAFPGYLTSSVIFSMLLSARLECYPARPPPVIIKSHFHELAGKISELSTNERDLKAYIGKRQKNIEAISDSRYQIHRWLQDASNMKEQLMKRLRRDRQASIHEKLRALGYENEDFDTQFDPKGWKWNQLIGQTRAVSDRVWENIRPQLEEIIKLRRAHAGANFLAKRRNARQLEFSRRFVASQPQVREIPFGKLYMRGDLQEEPFVEEILDENDAKIPLDDERWNRIFERIPELILNHKKVIEDHCMDKIRKALKESKTMSRPSDVSDNGQHPGDPIEDMDHIPSCLLSATSLFKFGGYQLEDYTEILHRRSLSPRRLWTMGGEAWSVDGADVASSGNVVSMASFLLKQLGLPEDTSMAYMLACGTDFQCLTCSRASQTSESSMSWAQLVLHFIHANDKYKSDLNTIKNKKLDIPFLNDHEVTSEITGNVVARVPRTTVDLIPTLECANRYSILSKSWGEEVSFQNCTESVKDASDGETQEDSDEPSATVIGTDYCPLCQKYGRWHTEEPVRGMRKHMRTRHGTDLEGNPLAEPSGVDQYAKQHLDM